MIRPLVSTIVVLTFVNSISIAADWTQFRGPGGLGKSSEQGLPVSWSDDENLTWKAELPGFGASSPITLGDHIYITCYSGYGVNRSNPGKMEDLLLHVVCLNRGNGKIVWDTHVKPKLPESRRVRDHGYAAATPTTDGKAIYVFFGKSGVYAFDLKGKQKWQADVGDGTHGWGCGTSPVLYKNLVIVNASVESGSLVAIDKNTGDEEWRARGMRASWNTPALVDVDGGAQELVVSVHSKILGFDPATGEQLWTCRGIQDYVCPSIVSENGIVYAIGGRSSKAIAVKAGGRGNVTETHKLWEANAGANVSSPVVFDGHLYWVSDRNRTAYCLDLKSGDIKYQKRFRGQPYASTIVGDGKLYVVTRYSGTFVLKATPTYEEISHNEFENAGTFNASPVISGGKLLLRSDQYLYCIGGKS